MLIWQESKSSAFILTVLRTQTCWQAAQWLRNPRAICVFEHQAWKSTVCKTSASQNHHWYEREMCWGLNALCLTPICTLSSTGWHQKMNLNLNYFVLCRAFLQVEYYLFIFIHLFIYLKHLHRCLIITQTHCPEFNQKWFFLPLLHQVPVSSAFLTYLNTKIDTSFSFAE